MRQPRPAEGDQFCSQLGTGICEIERLHNSLDLLAHFLVGNAEDCGISTAGCVDENVLRLLRIDVHAARDDHVGLAVGQIEISLGVEIADVTQ